jgi:hypothetical protein
MRALSVAVVVLLAGPAVAQPAPPLEVSLGPGAESCPDAAALLERIERIRSSPARADQPAYRVSFARDAAGMRAEIVREDTSASRALADQASDCAALAQATAVTLALLFDADTQANEAQPAPSLAAPPPVITRSVETEGAPRSALRSSIALGAGALLGVTRPMAPAVTLELDLRSALFRATLGALYAPAIALDFGDGRVDESLLAGSLYACVAPLAWSGPQAPWRFDLCPGAWLGALQARASGFDENGDSTRSWSALALDARISHVPAPLGAELAITLLIPLRRQDFAIDNAGVAYASWPVAMLVTLRGALGWTW